MVEEEIAAVVAETTSTESTQTQMKSEGTVNIDKGIRTVIYIAIGLIILVVGMLIIYEVVKKVKSSRTEKMTDSDYLKATGGWKLAKKIPVTSDTVLTENILDLVPQGYSWDLVPHGALMQRGAGTDYNNMVFRNMYPSGHPNFKLNPKFKDPDGNLEWLVYRLYPGQKPGYLKLWTKAPESTNERARR